MLQNHVTKNSTFKKKSYLFDIDKSCMYQNIAFQLK
jgi:hypothetical protein